jgi:hypothetical protein
MHRGGNNGRRASLNVGDRLVDLERLDDQGEVLEIIVTIFTSDNFAAIAT